MTLSLMDRFVGSSSEYVANSSFIAEKCEWRKRPRSTPSSITKPGPFFSTLHKQNAITVFGIFEGSPAYEKGLRRGDVIARIEGDDTQGWTSDQAVRQLRGPRGTAVQISIRRTGYEQLIDLEVLRDEIHIPTVRAAFMLDGTTGYILLSDFGENSDDEMGDALRTLRDQGMRRIVLDLRNNPGGALDQAINISNRFLPRGDLIVYTRGRVPNSDQDYRATQQSEYLELPMITLVNRNSASASEIVSGALQDHDRSLIVGETTFGKALVQSVYRVSGGAGVALTTSRYYTPSGRLIQRPWDGTFDEYLAYMLREQDASKLHKPDDLKFTDGGRRVYSGGGVEPDRRFNGTTEGFNPTRFSRTVSARNLFNTFAQRFTRAGDRRITASPSGQVRALSEDFEVTEGDGRRIQGSRADVQDEDRRRGVAAGPALHPGHAPLWN